MGFFLKQRGAAKAPPVQWRRPIYSFISLFRSPWFVIGCVVATTSWGFHVAALALAPISVVQAVIAGGLVLVTVLADRVFGHSVTRREWIGVGLTAAGLAFLALTLEGTVDEAHSDYGDVTLLGDPGRRDRRRAGARGPQGSGPALAVSAGLLWGASDIAIKAASDHTDLGLGPGRAPAGVRDPDPVARRPAGLGPLAPARPGRPRDRVDQRVREHPHDRLRPDRVRRAAAGGPVALLVRLAAFALVITAAAMTPPPELDREGAGEGPA